MAGSPLKFHFQICCVFLVFSLFNCKFSDKDLNVLTAKIAVSFIFIVRECTTWIRKIPCVLAKLPCVFPDGMNVGHFPLIPMASLCNGAPKRRP